MLITFNTYLIKTNKFDRVGAITEQIYVTLQNIIKKHEALPQTCL